MYHALRLWQNSGYDCAKERYNPDILSAEKGEDSQII